MIPMHSPVCIEASRFCTHLYLREKDLLKWFQSCVILYDYPTVPIAYVSIARTPWLLLAYVVETLRRLLGGRFCSWLTIAQPPPLPCGSAH